MLVEGLDSKQLALGLVRRQVHEWRFNRMPATAGLRWRAEERPRPPRSRPTLDGSRLAREPGKCNFQESSSTDRKTVGLGLGKYIASAAPVWATRHPYIPWYRIRALHNSKLHASPNERCVSFVHRCVILSTEERNSQVL